MSMPLLTSKLFAPLARASWVPRTRLIDQIEDGLRAGRRLTLVSAPAGFGKTTLVSDWSARHDAAVAWLSLDEEDDDSPRFWSYLIAALQTVDSGLCHEARQLVQGPKPLLARTIVSSLINDVAALAGHAPDLVLVLDDYHHIYSTDVHDGLTFLLEYQPPNMHMILSTRADPPLPLFRLRARGQLTELRTDDLRFTAAEAAAFFTGVMGLDLATGDVEMLDARTEGWIAGLQLAGLSLQGRADAHEFVAAFGGSHHYVLEYLTQEVVWRQSEAVQRFLARTCVLDRLCGSLCDAVTAEGNGDATLTDLYRRNLFIIPLDDEHHWYRYHHLFADLLRNLLRNEVSPEEIRVLHRRAALWHAEHGTLDDAIGHALEAQDFGQAAVWIELVAQELIAHGRLAALLGRLAALPEENLDALPRLRLYHGWALSLSGEVDAGERILQDTGASLERAPASAGNLALRGELAALLTGIASRREDTETVIHQAHDALAHLPETDLLSRARVLVALGAAHAYRDDGHEAARTWYQARDLALEAGNPFLATAAIELLAGSQIYHQGRLHVGAAALQQALTLGAATGGKLLPFTGASHALLGEVHFEWDELASARRYLDAGLDLLRRSGIGYALIHAHCAWARLASAQHDVEGVMVALHEAEQALDAHPMLHMVIHLSSYEARLRLWLGDVDAAWRWATGDRSLLRRVLPPRLPAYLEEVRQISMARVQLARHEADTALHTLEGLDGQASAAGRLAHAIDICLLRASALSARGEIGPAIVSLERALSWAEPEGYVRSFVEAGTNLIPLLHEAAARGTLPAYVERLLAAFPAEQRAEIELPSPMQAQPLIEPLTERELEVLQLLCAGLSNRDIASRLTVTLNTVKKHTSHIYGKLGVRSRAQAMVRARDLGLASS